MSATLIVDLLGHLSPIPERVAPADATASPDQEADLDGYLWGVFLPRSELMGWSNSRFDGTATLWNVEEAELTYHLEESQIGFAQVGLDVGPRIAGTLDPSTPIYVDGPFPERPDPNAAEGAHFAPFPMPEVPSTDPAVAIPPLIQCVDDSLRWFGETEVSAFQVTGLDVSRTTQPYPFAFVSVLNWFDVGAEQSRPRAVVTVAADQWDDRIAAEVVAAIQQTNTGSFRIGPLTSAPEGYDAGPEMAFMQWIRGESGIAISMPEWSPSAVGWVIARVFDAVLSRDPAPQNLSVRLTRTDSGSSS